MYYYRFFLEYLPIKSHQGIKRFTVYCTLAIILFAFLYSCTGGRIVLIPEINTFLGIYFREPFEILLILHIALFISYLKYSPQRNSEYIFLNSLPVSRNYFSTRFIFHDLIKHLWFIGLVIIHYSVLITVSPISHLIRLSFLSFLLYLIMVLSNTILHLYFSAPGRVTLRTIYPGKYNSVLSAAVIIVAFALNLVFILFPSLASGIYYLMISTLMLITIYCLHKISEISFYKWRKSNPVYVKAQTEENVGSHPLKSNIIIQFFKNINPFIYKNLLRIIRKNKTSSLFLTSLFLMLNYALAINNTNINDAETILFGFSHLYIFLFVFKSMEVLSPDVESQDIIYSNPVKKLSWILSVFLPVFLWLAVIITILTVLMLVSGGVLNHTIILWLRTILSAACITIIAFNLNAINFPDFKKARKHFLYLLILLMNLAMVQFKVYLILCLVIIGITLLILKSIRLYKVV